jgi:hypothetical protein
MNARHRSTTSATSDALSPSAKEANDNNLQRKASMSISIDAQDTFKTGSRPLAASDLVVNTGHIRLEPEVTGGGSGADGSLDGMITAIRC